MHVATACVPSLGFPPPEGRRFAEEYVGRHHERIAVAVPRGGVLEELSRREIRVAAGNLQLRRVDIGRLKIDFASDVCAGGARDRSRDARTAGAVETVGGTRQP